MNSLQDALSEEIMNHAYDTAADIICAKFLGQGVSVTQRQRQKLIAQLKSGKEGVFRIGASKFWDKREISITIDDADLARLTDNFDRFIEEDLPNLVPSLVEEIFPEVLQTLRTRWDREYRRQSRELKAFRKNLQSRWGGALHRFGMLLSVARELGESAANSLPPELRASSPRLVEVLPRLQIS